MVDKALEKTNPVIMEIESDPNICAQIAARRERCERNVRWLEAHADEAYSHRGKYICIAGEELFVAKCPEEVLSAAQAAHPDDDGRFTLYIPLDRTPRIYASCLT
ncbi:MAG: hypothetical protein ACREHD_08585 [Pirellulales bacterium]